LKYIIYTLFTIVFATGCANSKWRSDTPPDYGTQVSMENAETIIKEYMKTSLKDPYSVQDFKILNSDPKKCFWKNIYGSFYPNYYGWCIIHQYNAKNSYGAYIGLEKHVAIIKDGKISGYDPKHLYDEKDSGGMTSSFKY